MLNSNITNFNGKINKQSLNDFTLDYSTNAVDDRLKHLNKELHKIKDSQGRNYFETYIDEYFKVNVSSEDNLSEKINVFKKLEVMADYLLRSTEVRAERKSNETKYYFYVNRDEFLKRTKSELNISTISDIEQDAVMHFLSTKNKSNTKKEKIQKISRQDFLKGDYLSQILSEYNKMLELLNNSIGKINKRKVDVLKGAVKDDMLRVKDSLNGVFGYTLRNPLPDSTAPSWEKFDFTNVEHVRLALNIKRNLDPNDDLSHIILSLKDTIEQLWIVDIITQRQKQLLDLYQDGYTCTEIAKEFDITTVTVHKAMKSIAKKITEFYKFKEKNSINGYESRYK